MNMNNKGQSLVIFIIVLPICFLLITYVTFLFYSTYEKNNQEHIADIICKYSKNEKNITELLRLGKENDNKQDIIVNNNDGKIEVKLTKKIMFDIELKTTLKCE